MAINITGRWDLVSWYKISNQVCIFIRRYNVLFPCRIFTGERWSDANAAYINTIFHGLTTQLTPTYPLIHSKTCRAARSFRAWPNEETSACSEKGYTSWPRVYITFPVFPRKSLTGRLSECRRISSLSPRTSTHNCAISNIILAFFLSDRSLELGLKVHYMLPLPLAAFACCKAVFETDTFCHFFLLLGIDSSCDGFAVRFRLLLLLLPSGSGSLTWLSSSLFLQANDFDGRLVWDM